MKHFDPLQELDTSPDSAFVQAVDSVVAEPTTGNLLRPIFLGYTPLVLRLSCDIDIGEIKSNYLVLEKVMAHYLERERFLPEDKTPHNLTPEQVKEIPAQMNDPIAIIQSQTKASIPNDKKPKYNGLVVLTELFEVDKFTKEQKPVFVAIHLKTKERRVLDCKITTANGRSAGFIVTNLSSNLLMYLNREKCRHLFLDYLNTPNVRRHLKRDGDNERIQIIAELCGLEYNKGRYQPKTTATIAEGNSLHQTENDLLFDTNNTQKPNILQAVKQKILPKQPKRTIPTPTGYKTEEDLKAFREETQKRPLTLGEAQAVGKRLLPLVTPPDSPVFTPQLQQLNDCLTSIYQNGKTVSRNNIERMIQRHADKIVSQKMRQKLYQANNQQQSTGQTHNPPEQSKDKGGREC